MPTKRQPCRVMRTALAFSCAGLAVSAGKVHADDTLSGFYVSTAAGLNLTSDLIAPKVSISLRPGVRGDASVGYAWRLADELSVGAELETGVLYNSLDKANAAGQSTSVGGSLTDVPLLAHAVLNWHFHSHWVAYAGAGVGCAISSLHADTGGINYGLNGTETDFAWQTMAGVRYQFGSSEVGLGYEHFSFGRSGLQTIGNNTILASYTFRF